MGRQARIKRERRRTRAEAPAETDAPDPADESPARPAPMVLTIPLPGFEHAADENGHFDDCPICQALREGDEARANRLVRKSGKRIDISKLNELDLTPFLEWCAAEGIDLESPTH